MPWVVARVSKAKLVMLMELAPVKLRFHSICGSGVGVGVCEFVDEEELDEDELELGFVVGLAVAVGAGVGVAVGFWVGWGVGVGVGLFVGWFRVGYICHAVTAANAMIMTAIIPTILVDITI
jgi:hypothetical protein